ncbi:MAG: hypothetical protein U9N34_09090, partial [Candidatus Cloacimonadota bacterium]|nr:hypothetical protein [Candidatus Cloacimonadota bacterium]
MKYLIKLFYFFSLFIIYIILKEFLELYAVTKSIHPYFGYSVMIILVSFIIYFGIAPLLKIVSMKNTFSPIKDENQIEMQLQKRMEAFKKNPAIDFNVLNLTGNLQADYDLIVQQLEKKSNEIRHDYVTRLFVSTTVSQNGFIDSILIFSASVNLIKEIFTLYQGRTNIKNVFSIFKEVYLSMAIGGSQGVEYAIEELIQKFASDGLKNVPFFDKFFTSIADGFVNAAFLTRVSLISENYCKTIMIKSKRDLYPSTSFIFSSTKHIVQGTFRLLRKRNLKNNFFTS